MRANTAVSPSWSPIFGWVGISPCVPVRSGLSWLPPVDAPEHHETPRSPGSASTATTDWATTNAGLEVMSCKQAGRIAVTAAHVADSIHRTPVWGRDFFDLHSVRVDLTAEITYLTEAAKTLAEQDKPFRPAPIAQRALDAEIVGVYIEKSRILDERIDACSRDSKRSTRTGRSSRMQRRADRQDWLDRVNTIDDLDSAASAVADHHHADAAARHRRRIPRLGAGIPAQPRIADSAPYRSRIAAHRPGELSESRARIFRNANRSRVSP